MIRKLKSKVSAIDTSGSVLKSQCNNNKSVLENKIDGTSKKLSYTSGLDKKQTTMLRSLKLKLNFLIQMGQLLLLLLIQLKTRYLRREQYSKKNKQKKKQKTNKQILM